MHDGKPKTGPKGLTVPMSASSTEQEMAATFRANEISVSDVNITSERQSKQKQTSESCLNIVAKKRPPPMNIGYSFFGIEPTRKVLYRNFHDIQQQVYLVEISRNQKKVFILLFPNFEKPNQYIQEILTDKQATKLLNDCDNIFENFIARFFIKFNKL